MTHTDDENLRWWARLTKLEQGELFDIIIEKASSAVFVDYAKWMKLRWERGEQPLPSKIETLRKWAK